MGIISPKPNGTRTDRAQGNAESPSQRFPAHWWETDEQDKYEEQ